MANIFLGLLIAADRDRRDAVLLKCIFWGGKRDVS